MALATDKIIQFPFQSAVENGWSSALGFYTPKQAARIAQVPYPTANEWRNKGIVIPTSVWRNEEGREINGYTYAGLVYLRLIRLLRNKYPLRKIVLALAHLHDVFGPPGPNWSQANIFTDGTEVWVDHSFGVLSTSRRGQKAATVMFGREFEQLRRSASPLLIPSRYIKSIELDPSVRNGLPIIKETSITTELIHSLRQQGLKYATLLEYYPFLRKQQLVFAEAYERLLDREQRAA